MNAITLLVVYIAWTMVSVHGLPDPPACNSLKPATVDSQWLIRSNPWILYRSNLPIYKCGLAAVVGPAGDSTSYTGTSIVLQGNYTFSYDFNLVNNSLIKTVLCSNGAKTDFQTVYVNSYPPSASICVVSCNDYDATKYDAIVCAGRTPKDESDIEKFLDGGLKDVEGMVNLQSGCPKPQYCNAFTT